MIIQIDLGDSLAKAQRLLGAIAEISTDADDILAPAIKEKSSKASALITEVGVLLKGGHREDILPQLNKPDVRSCKDFIVQEFGTTDGFKKRVEDILLKAGREDDEGIKMYNSGFKDGAMWLFRLIA